ncbi:hypothetical protein CPB83DRAFT_430122 [Crepidotus variabilis]|uniref:F-box domain-containing protein n=1 Tax=Crepidotus variabilis TaxID=179855 RepID=A0A9P6EE19_9AGAR|nr:hypothetical protein CPB83DRAFT_430122 [Crepidotus variabilis]
MNGAGQRRSKRLKTQESSKKATTLNESTSNSYLGTLRGQNVKGLATLPDELLLEILAKFPSFTTPKRSYTPTGFDLQSHNTRRQIFSTRCLTCKNLRRFFLPYLWEYIESYGGLEFEGRSIERPEHPSQEKACVMELIRQLEMVTVRIPSLAKYVRVIDAVVVKYSEGTVLAELARCMALLPNLKTVKFVEPTDTRYSGSRRASPERPAWRKAFKGTSYPQIQTALLAPPFYALAKSIPGLRSLQPIENIELSTSSCLDFVQDPAALQHFYLPILCVKFVPQVYPNIRHLELTSTLC